MVTDSLQGRVYRGDIGSLLKGYYALYMEF